MKLVPNKPTDAMLAAGQSAWLADPLRKSSTLYRAMVEAAPAKPDAQFWLDRRTEIIAVLAAEGLEICSDKGRVWLRRSPGVTEAPKC